jgi:hypothetical protein
VRLLDFFLIYPRNQKKKKKKRKKNQLKWGSKKEKEKLPKDYSEIALDK